MSDIYLALLMYAGEEAGYYLPPDLGMLLDSGQCLATKLYVIPGSGTKLPRTGNDIRDGMSDYVLLTPGRSLNQLPSVALIAASHPRLAAQHGISVLLRSGEVVWYNTIPADVEAALNAL